MESVKLDIRQIFEDITYTNKVCKTCDVEWIITRCQYYALKDKIIHTLIKNKIVDVVVNDFEYTIGKDGSKIMLARLTLQYGGTQCLIHQALDSKLRDILGITDIPETDIRYEHPQYEIDYNQKEFEAALSRLRYCRVVLMRSMMENNQFAQACHVNYKSDCPWIKDYIGMLPQKGNSKFNLELI